MKAGIGGSKSILMVLVVCLSASRGSAVDKPTTAQKTCVTNECHGDYSKKQHVHGPVGLGDCKSCHEAGDLSKHTFALVGKEPALCEKCHMDKANKKNVHVPLKDGCTQCHDPHVTGNKFMLRTKTVGESCKQCHKIGVDMQYMHGPAAVGQCTICHDSHSSDHARLLTMDASELCFSCHDKPVQVTEDKVLAAFTDEIENKPFLHGPVGQKDCQGCHITHGSKHFRLLRKEYPPKFYSPFKKENYELCFTCHAETLVLTKKTDTLTDFRNGYQNLHFLHVNKAERGRTCRSCHATHASNHPRHIRESVPYGMWELPIGFEKTETGGKCAPGCHLPFSYDRVSPVEYKKPQAAPTGQQEHFGDLNVDAERLEKQCAPNPGSGAGGALTAFGCSVRRTVAKGEGRRHADGVLPAAAERAQRAE